MSNPIKVKLFGAGCSRCFEAELVIREFFKNKELNMDLEKVNDMKEMVKKGIVVTPAIEINGELLFHGRIPKMHELEKWLSSYLKNTET